MKLISNLSQTPSKVYMHPKVIILIRRHLENFLHCGRQNEKPRSRDTNAFHVSAQRQRALEGVLNIEGLSD